MPIYRDKARKRWRFEYDRVHGHQRKRLTRLLPAPWTRAQADAFDQAESARLFGLFSGAQRHRPTIDDAVKLYLRERLPQLKSADATEEHIAAVLWAYHGRFMDELPEVAKLIAEHVVLDDGRELAPATVRNRIACIRGAHVGARNELIRRSGAGRV